MSVRKLVSPLALLFPRHPAIRRRPPLGRLYLEALEDRSLLSVVAGLNGTTLQVSVSSGDTSGHTVRLQQNTLDSTKTDVLDAGQTVGTFDNASFSKIAVTLAAGDDTIDLGDVLVPAKGITLDGGAGSNTLLAQDTTNTWAITAADTGSVNGVAFTNVGTLMGGTGADTFAFNPSSSLSGTINGGGGSDTIDYSAFGKAVSVDLRKQTATATDWFAGKATATAGFFQIQNLVGSRVASTLTGPNLDTVWSLTKTNQGSLSSAGSSLTYTLTYQRFANLVGGSGQDAFQFNDNALVTGYVNGGGGQNTLDYSAANYPTTSAFNFKNFASPPNLALNGASLVKTADGNVLRMVTTGANEAHSAYDNQMVSTANFSTTFTFRATNPGGVKDPTGHVGADGLVFVLQNGSPRTTAASTTGGSLDYNNRFPDSIGIAFDTFKNTGLNDSSSNELGIDFNGVAKHGTGNGATVNVSPNFDNGKLWHVWIDYDGTTLNIYATTSSTKPATPTLSQNLNLPLIIGSAFAFPGFTAATGSGWEHIDVLKWGFSSTTPLPSNPGVLVDVHTPSAPSHNATGIGGGFKNIQNFIGSAGFNDFRGDGKWQITGDNVGTLGKLTFTNFQQLEGTAKPSTFTFSDNAHLDGALFTGPGKATVTLAAGVSVAGDIHGGKGVNTLVGPSAGATWSLTGTNAGSVAGVNFTRFANLVGSTGVDTFAFQAGAQVTGNIDGGGGGDWLDYSQTTVAATVDLGAGTATAVGGSIANIQNVIGSDAGSTLTGDSQGNILIGGAGVDTIVGGTGRSILIGGAGNDAITGGSDEDIVIGGSVNFGANAQTALQTILNEWQRTDETYDQRISNLRAGVGPGNAYQLVWGSTVLDDGGSNALQGDPTGGPTARDWFFADLAAGHDTIADLALDEIVN
jgi:hypothetical protein